MKLRWLFLYGALMSVLSIAAVTFFSVFLAMQGVSVPWVQTVPSGYAVNHVATVPIGLWLGAIITLSTHALAMRKHSSAYYFMAILPIVLVISFTFFLLYASACKACATSFCSHVSSCGINVQITLTLFELYCNCAQALPGFIAGLI